MYTSIASFAISNVSPGRRLWLFDSNSAPGIKADDDCRLRDQAHVSAHPGGPALARVGGGGWIWAAS
jgi:hypothetical protein